MLWRFVLVLLVIATEVTPGLFKRFSLRKPKEPPRRDSSSSDEFYNDRYTHKTYGYSSGQGDSAYSDELSDSGGSIAVVAAPTSSASWSGSSEDVGEDASIRSQSNADSSLTTAHSMNPNESIDTHMTTGDMNDDSSQQSDSLRTPTQRSTRLNSRSSSVQRPADTGGGVRSKHVDRDHSVVLSAPPGNGFTSSARHVARVSTKSELLICDSKDFGRSKLRSGEIRQRRRERRKSYIIATRGTTSVPVVSASTEDDLRTFWKHLEIWLMHKYHLSSKYQIPGYANSNMQWKSTVRWDYGHRLVGGVGDDSTDESSVGTFNDVKKMDPSTKVLLKLLSKHFPKHLRAMGAFGIVVIASDFGGRGKLHFLRARSYSITDELEQQLGNMNAEQLFYQRDLNMAASIQTIKHVFWDGLPVNGYTEMYIYDSVRRFVFQCRLVSRFVPGVYAFYVTSMEEEDNNRALLRLEELIGKSVDPSVDPSVVFVQGLLDGGRTAAV